MIVGLTGSICSGKETLAKYLVEVYGFEAVNILDLFKQRITELQKENKGKKLSLDIKVVNIEAESPAKHFGSRLDGLSTEPAKKEEEFLLPQDVPMSNKLSKMKKVPSLSCMDGYQQLSQDAQEQVNSPADILDEDQYCFQYYHKKYRDIRLEIIKDLFRSLTSRWKQDFVIYPLGSTNEIQHCL